ncbi:MAG TPA: ABC transporter permease [Pyrinomonadaceae bacterium]
MQTLLQDLRYAVRTLRSRPGFTLVAVLTLSLGIGANTAIFSVVNAVLLRPLPFKDPDRIVSIYERRANSGAANLPVSGHEFAAWQQRTHSFAALTLIQPDGLNLTGNGDPTILNVSRVSTDFFSVIGVGPIIGRTFAPGEDQNGGANVVILNEKLWQQRFGSNRDILNHSITLNNQNYTVVGVMPTLELMPDVLIPIDLHSEIQKVGKHSHQVIGRLKEGVSVAQAQADLALVSGQLEQEMVQANKGHGSFAINLHEDVTGDSSLALLTLFGAVGFVLLISCANVANLLLTRAAARHKEMAIRSALGAGRLRLIRQTLTESLLLGIAGGGLGLLSAFWIVDLISKMTVLHLPRLDQVRLDSRVLLATLVFSLLTGVLTGLVPALRNSEQHLYETLIDGGRGSMSASRRRLGSALVVMEVALAVILLVGGGLMLKSFVHLMRVDPGFDPHQVLRLDLGLPAAKYSEPQKQRAFYEELLGRLRNLPGVESVGATTQTPLSPGDNWSGFAIEGRPVPEGDQQQAATRTVSNDYFSTLRIPLRRGRLFSNADARVALPLIRWFEKEPFPEHFNDSQPIPTAIINETLAKQYWPNEDPIGKRLKVVESPWLTIVGVVGNVHHNGLNTAPNPEIYLSHLQEPQNSLAVMMRTSVDPLSLATAARQEINAIDKDQPVTITTMDQIVADSVAGQRFNALLLGVFAALALILATIGVFGVINYSVAQRTREIGIRLALGAQRRDVFQLIVGQGLALAITGVVIGAIGSFGLTRLIAGLLYGVSPTDRITFLFVSVLVTVVALLASYLPARRATKIDPLVALKYE